MIISIVIPTYNRSSLIARALKSVAILTDTEYYHSIEILIMDNGNDDTVIVVEKFKNNHPNLNIRYFHDTIRGVNRARNNGIEAATGDWIAFLDSDDEYVPGGLNTIVSSIETIPKDVGVVGFMTMREVNGIMEPRGYDVGGSWKTYRPSYEDVVMKEKIRGDIHYCIRKSVFQSGFSFPEDIQGFESYFFATIAKHGINFFYVNKVVDQRYTDGFEHIGSYKKWPKQFARYYLKFANDFKDVLVRHPTKLRYFYRSAGTSYLRVGDPRGLWWLLKAYFSR